MAVISLAAAAGAQTSTVQLPKPDSAGWIKLWRGDNASDFYTYYSPTNTNKTFPDNTFKFSKDTIVVSGSPTGHIVFKQAFSHYRVRFEMMEPNTLGNCGMLVHVQMGDPALFNQFPRSIECQGDPTQGMGQIWCISNVWVNVHATTNGTPKYTPTAPEITYGGKDDNSRQILGIKKPEMKVGEWVMMEAEVHGSDSLEHLVRGETIIKYSNPIVATGGNPTPVQKTLKSGLLAWQSEGVAVRYRNIQIKLFKEDPLYASLYGSTGIADYRILPKAAGKPALRMEAGVLSVLRGSRSLTLTGRALPSANAESR
jgi:hypothetical protein